MSAEQRIRVSVLVVTYNSAAVIGPCLRPLADEPDIEIVVLDNDSHDDTLETVGRVAPRARIVRNSANLGFARGVNAAAAQARGEHLLLLNPDARIAPADVRALSRVLDDGAGIAAPVLEKPGNRLTIREGGRRPGLWRVVCHYYGLSRLSSTAGAVEGLYLLKRNSFVSRDVDWVSGACLMTHAGLWRELGGLTTRWFMYAEDLEYCLRVQEAGHRIVMSAEASGVHTIGESSAPSGESRPNSAWVVNLYDLYKWRLSRSRIQNLAWKCAVGGGLLARSAAYRVKAVQDPSRRQSWLEESRKFSWYARDLLRVPSSATKDAAGEVIDREPART
ncbi:glycosyltransferase family 2 protein [Rhodococcus opacus]|uniref:glycosyltransferase family 2 protein n=1 Tax=Rhodococcus opacus TaxID=37919 RepID=UPI001C488619|nr:glycosyltransferase family 2 protein [Rhodococcus opacus]MBV6760679.1 glycosyltransferase family 2 protein [Rhodococcus opacus]